ncbi:MIZ/SP-RING zinc finger [Metarhizium robertsii ARSEF 23]|uniref:MIZ/SP-RING zinc finger n=1 Tax=Metarhizium robertsii (strain ARSEF 23 / ATCC MYA-3075) TaxID=655844 RepID=E9EJH3_METRA|nr:MIZ/SP-RING zinc finger [Metarhizium robertsii ARSEF 23]EFZ02969.2 MIZ/SP-RING zinc finger [Metarhizium robertsii ARSEF 23]
MSISTPSNGKNAPPCDNDAESRRIGAANKTSLAFIGGHQPTWMLSSSASSLPTKSPTGIRKKKHFSRPVPPRLSLDKIINATVSVQQGQTTQDSQPSLEVVETGCTDSLPSLAEKSPERILSGQSNVEHAPSPSPSPSPSPPPPPSPAPKPGNSDLTTKESPRVELSGPFPSPVTKPMNSSTVTIESPQVVSRGPFPSPPPTLPMESRNPQIEEVAGQATMQDACASDGNVASNTATPRPHHRLSLPYRNSVSSHAPATCQVSPPLPQQDGSWQQPAQQLPQQINVGGFVYQLMKPAPVANTNNSNNPSLHTNAPASVACSTSPYRHPPDTQAQPAMSISPDTLATWRRRLVEFINHPKGPNHDATFLEAWRCSALLDACQFNDVFFLVLHQFYCLWSTNPGFLCSILPSSCHGHLDPSFELLATVLKPNTDIRQHHLSWFAYYPYSLVQPAHTHPSFNETSIQVVRFLVSFVLNWSKWLTSVRNRRYPVMVQELKEGLLCHSLGAQILLFTYSWRLLGTGNQLIAEEFGNVFQADRENERLADMHPGSHRVHETRKVIRHSYITVTNHMISQSNITTSHGYLVLTTGEVAAARFTAAQTQSNSVASVNQSYNTTVSPVTSSAFAACLSPHDASSPGTPFVQGQSPNAPWQTQFPTPNVIPQTRAVASAAPVGHHPREAGLVPGQTPIPGQQRFVQSARNRTNHRHLSHPGSLVGRPTSQIVKNRHSSHERTAQKKLVANTHAGMARGQSATAGGGFSTAPPREADCPQSQYGWTSVQSSLHLARSRSPRRVTAEGPGTRYYQYLDRFAVKPTALFHQNGAIQTFDFAVTSTEFAERSQLLHFEEAKVHRYQQGSLRYRLRLSGQLPEDTTTCIADWASSPCVWPQEVYIKFNDEAVFPLRPQHFHQNLPIELTDMIRQGFNTVKISLPENPENYKDTSVYYLAVEIIKTMDHESTFAMVMELEAFSVEQTEKEIEKRLRPDDSDDVIVQDDSLCISLIDPFSASMVKSPVRGLRFTQDGNWTAIEEPQDGEDGENGGSVQKSAQKRAEPAIIEILDDD